jgi:glycosyltransferase involved in cell wall biosynthesis
MIKVSIVVPVYNTEKYLMRCIESLRSQSLSDIEILLVDDGSTDGCPAICDRAAGEDKRIRVIHKRNGGLSSARNAGMAAAQGDYIGFADSDDTCGPEMYKILYETALREKTDFVMADTVRVPVSGESYLITQQIREGRYDRKDIVESIFPRLIMEEKVDYGPLLAVWRCLYRREFLESHQLTFDEQVRWSEDNLFSALAGYYADSFYYLKGQGLYYYYENAGSITTRYNYGAWDVYCLMNDKLRDVFDQAKEYDFSRQLELHIIYYACSVIGRAAALDKKEALKEIRTVLRSEILREAFRKIGLPKTDPKLKVLLLFVKYRQAGILYRYYSRMKK